MAIAEAEVRVTADTRDFPADLQRKLRSSAASFEKSFGRTVGDSLSKATQKSFQGTERHARYSGGLAGRSFTAYMGRSLFRGLRTTVAGAFKGLSSLFASLGQQAAKAGMGGISTALSGASTALGSLSKAGPAGAIALGVLGAAAAAASAVLVSLAAHIFQAAGALTLIPAAAIGIAGVVTAAALAFDGFGAALKNAASGNMEAFNKNLQQMPGPMRAVVSELKPLGGYLKGLKKDVQVAFWGQLNGQLTALGKNLGGPVKTGLTQMADAMGNVASQVLKVFSGPLAKSAFTAVFGNMAKGIKAMGPGLAQLTRGFLAMAQAVAPVLKLIGEDLGSAFERLGKWMEKVSQGGDASKAFGWAKTGWETLKQLGDVALTTGKIIANVLNTIFKQDSAKGGTALDSLSGLLKDLEKWTVSPKGQKTIRDMTDAAQDAAGAISSLVKGLSELSDALTGKKINLKGAFPPLLIDDILKKNLPGYSAVRSFLGGWYKKAFEGITGQKLNLGNMLKNAFPLASVYNIGKNLGGKLWDGIKSGLSGIKDSFGSLFSGKGLTGGKALSLGGLFDFPALSGLKDKIASALSGLGSLGGGALNFLVNTTPLNLALTVIRNLGSAWNLLKAAALTAVNFAVNSWPVQAAANVVRGLVTAWNWLRTTATAAVSFAVNSGPVRAAMGVIGAARAAWGGLRAAASAAVRFLTNTSLISAAIGLINRAKSLWSQLKSAAASAAKFAVNTGPISAAIGVLQRLKGLWDSLRSKTISLGVSVAGGARGLLDRFFATGGIVSRPVMGMVGEAGPEVIIPLKRSMQGRAVDLAKSSGLYDQILKDAARRSGVQARALKGFDVKAASGSSRRGSGGGTTVVNNKQTYNNQKIEVVPIQADPSIVAAKVMGRLVNQGGF